MQALCPPLLLACAALLPAQARVPQASVDPRVELFSIVFRLAGNPEYSSGKVDAYTRAVDQQFGSFEDHAVVQHAARLRRGRGVSYDAVMGLAVHLDQELRPLLPLEQAARLDPRWPRGELQAFVAELRDFAADSKFAAFVREQRPLYELTAKRMQAVLERTAKLDWFDGFFGARPGASFELRLGLLNGGGCYGPSVALAGGKEQLYCILGVWATDADGQPSFDDSVVGTVAHEFCHSYCNPLVDAHLAELLPIGDKLWPLVADEMRQQAYGNARTLLCESLVRACVVRYQQANHGDAAAQREVQEQVQRGFRWTGELAAALGEYEAARQQYKTLDPFVPKLAACLADHAERAVAEQAKLPRVLQIVPAIGAEDVDPGLQAIVVTFDRPMRDGNWSVVGGGEHFPNTTGRPSYDDARKMLTIPVELKPDWSYELWLNRGRFDSFQSEDGHKLRPVHVTFRTRK